MFIKVNATVEVVVEGRGNWCKSMRSSYVYEPQKARISEPTIIGLIAYFNTCYFSRSITSCFVITVSHWLFVMCLNNINLRVWSVDRYNIKLLGNCARHQLMNKTLWNISFSFKIIFCEPFLSHSIRELKCKKIVEWS